MYDVIVTSDLRFPGGTSHSIAEELTAQAGAGYRTGLVHLNGPLVRRLRPFNPLIRGRIEAGAAELLVGPRRVRTSLLVIRHPAIAQEALDQLPPIDANRVVVVANAGPRDIDGRVHYDPALVTERVQDRLGVRPQWAPIGPLVRGEITASVAPADLLGSDWVNIIDVDQWAVDRPGWSADRPVIGRHSRPSAQKWPENAEVIRQVYPTDGSWDVRILGGADPVEQVLGAMPQSWTVLPFGEISPREFLAGLDFFVYYHDSRWVEAFGRTILEAIASGLPAVIPPHFEELFGPAALYAEPHEVRDLVDGLRADRGRYAEHVEQARSHVRSTFGHEAHVARLDELVGPPSDPAHAAQEHPAEDTPPRLNLARTQRPPDASRPAVLFMSSNGAGMGHLTRLLAYARRLGEHANPYFLSMSQAAPVVSRFDFPYEYLPSSGALSMPTRIWQRLFAERVLDTLDRVRPEVVIFDGTWPYNGIPSLREARPDVRWIWSRRGMWRRGANIEQLEKSAWFDLILEPGDFAAEYDDGATAGAPAHRVRPVTLLDREESEDRSAARSALDVPGEGPLALVSLGAGNINDPTGDIGAVATALTRLGVGVCVTHPEIAGSSYTHGDVHLVRDYPLSKRFAAFDLVISASGYNSFQELLRMGAPSLFVPNQETALDDQEARARYASDRGWSQMLDGVTVETVEPLLADLLERGTEKASRAVTADPGNGASQAAETIVELAHSRKGGHS